jgi:hypothetical protein
MFFWTNPDLYDILPSLPPSSGSYSAPSGRIPSHTPPDLNGCATRLNWYNQWFRTGLTEAEGKHKE